MALVAVVLIAGLAYYLLGPANAGPTPARVQSSAAPTRAAPLNVTQAYLTHLDEFANKTSCAYSATCVYSIAALNDYTNKSEISWAGDPPLVVGNYTGLASIQSMYETLSTLTATIDLHIISTSASGEQLRVVMNVTGTSEHLGDFAGTVDAQVTYAYANGSWSIAREVWNYTYFTSEYNGTYQPYANYAGA